MGEQAADDGDPHPEPHHHNTRPDPSLDSPDGWRHYPGCSPGLCILDGADLLHREVPWTFTPSGDDNDITTPTLTTELVQLDEIRGGVQDVFAPTAVLRMTGEAPREHRRGPPERPEPDANSLGMSFALDELPDLALGLLDMYRRGKERLGDQMVLEDLPGLIVGLQTLYRQSVMQRDIEMISPAT